MEIEQIQSIRVHSEPSQVYWHMIERLKDVHHSLQFLLHNSNDYYYHFHTFVNDVSIIKTYQSLQQELRHNSFQPFIINTLYVCIFQQFDRACSLAFLQSHPIKCLPYCPRFPFFQLLAGMRGVPVIIIEFINKVMLTSSSRICREQQVKVVIRLKPEQESKFSRCVFLSELENQLMVETDLKKQVFLFDHVAHQFTNQSDIYKLIGKDAVSTSFEGFNCSIFAYGQTGAGKTYSIMGDSDALQRDMYCESRGILPRLIEDIFEWRQANKEQKYNLTCSYIEIYNEQIFDLLSTDKRTHQIRQNKKGVFVQGLRECRLSSYKQGMELIMEGENSRRIALTTMNTQSSRSHVIFTIYIESEIAEDDRVITKKSKLNVIDLAGSERIKHTNVEGERLKEGCNINKSLHVLGNVINSLLQSAKKKKYIPYRDSKLTYYLKDSLGGNSITKLLANVHCGKQYFGDTLSTLMFAKRIKNLKMKVEVNINESDNFNNLRQQVKRLREELAQARYFKNDQRSEKSQNDQDLSMTYQKVTTDNTDYEVTPKLEIIEIFTENEQHYKTLIDIYEAHMKECTNAHSLKRRTSVNMVNQWKNLENRNNALTGLIKRFPSFTKIYKENLLLKQSKHKDEDEIQSQPNCKSQKHMHLQESSVLQQPQKHHQIPNYHPNVQEIIKKYESIINQLQQKFTKTLQIIQKSYLQLQVECKKKERRIKEILTNSEVPADIQQLKNENEYLKLNILNLENEISKLQQNEARMKIQNRQSKKNSIRHSQQSKQGSFFSQASQQQNDEELHSIIQKLKQVQVSALKEAEAVDKQKMEMEQVIQQLKAQITILTGQNNKIQRKYERSRSRQGKQSNYSSISKKQIPIDLLSLKDEMSLSQKSNIAFQSEIKSIHQGYSKQITVMKYDIHVKQKEIADLKSQLNSFMDSDYKIEAEFGKGLSEIVAEYRQMVRRQRTKQLCKIPKSTRNQNKDKQKFFEAVSKFDHIFIQDKDRKSSLSSFNSNNESRLANSRQQKGKKQQLKASSKSNSNTKNNGMTQSSTFYIHK